MSPVWESGAAFSAGARVFFQMNGVYRLADRRDSGRLIKRENTQHSWGSTRPTSLTASNMDDTGACWPFNFEKIKQWKRDGADTHIAY